MDASLVLHLLLPDERDLQTEALWQNWSTTGVRVIGPMLLYAEVTSVLRLRVATGRLTADEGEAAFTAFNALGIAKVDRDDLHIRAWRLAQQFQTRRAYDMMYLALAQLEDLELWTGDERLVNTIGGQDPRVKWVPATGNSTP
ncbi:MAG TPA: type II toxin-antitoxin system VapC family toxin [Ktedonobacterales bacterium]